MENTDIFVLVKKLTRLDSRPVPTSLLGAVVPKSADFSKPLQDLVNPPHLCATQWPVWDLCGGPSPGSVLKVYVCRSGWTRCREQAQELVPALESRFPELLLPPLPPVRHAGSLGLPLPGSLPWGEWGESIKHRGLALPFWERSSSRQFPFLRVSGSCAGLLHAERETRPPRQDWRAAPSTLCPC